MTTWLRTALVLHGRTLADPGFYVVSAITRSTSRWDSSRWAAALGAPTGCGWPGIASRRWSCGASTRRASRTSNPSSTRTTTTSATGARGSTSGRRTPARPGVRACGPHAALPRAATLPNGTVRDARRHGGDPAPLLSGHLAEFVATAGSTRAEPPPVMAFADGYLFARSGWGEDRAFADETFLSVRWGDAPRTVHGHPDGTAVTLYGWGTPAARRSGEVDVQPRRVADVLHEPAAHDVVTVDGLAWRRRRTTVRLSRTQTSGVRRRHLAHGRLRRRPPGPTGHLVAAARLPAGRGPPTSTTTAHVPAALASRRAVGTRRSRVRPSSPIGRAATSSSASSSARRRCGSSPAGRTRSRAGSPTTTATRSPLRSSRRSSAGHASRYLTLIVPAQGAPAVRVVGPAARRRRATP